MPPNVELVLPLQGSEYIKAVTGHRAPEAGGGGVRESGQFLGEKPLVPVESWLME